MLICLTTQCHGSIQCMIKWHLISTFFLLTLVILDETGRVFPSAFDSVLDSSQWSIFVRFVCIMMSDGESYIMVDCFCRHRHAHSPPYINREVLTELATLCDGSQLTGFCGKHNGLILNYNMYIVVSRFQKLRFDVYWWASFARSDILLNLTLFTRN